MTPTAATAQLTISLSQAEVERIVTAASLMVSDGRPKAEVESWAKAEVAKAVTVR